MPLDKSKIHKILVISLSNIGDVILTFPVLDILKHDFPEAELSVVIGPKALTLLKRNPNFTKIYVFHKHQSPLKMLAWMWALKKERFDLVIDLRNTMIAHLLFPRYRTSSVKIKVNDIHMRQKHLDRLKSIYPFSRESKHKISVHITQDDQQTVNRLIINEIGREHPFIVIAPGAADERKRWPVEKFARLPDLIAMDHKLKIVFAGDQTDQVTAQNICGQMNNQAVNLCGRVSLTQLAQLFKKSVMAIGNDSAPMHLASYLNLPVITIFGPTNPVQYGPWSANSRHFSGDHFSGDNIFKSFEIKKGCVLFSENI